MIFSQKPIQVVAAIIQRDFDLEKRCLIVRRGGGQSGAGFWEFPGGKVEFGEGAQEALIREVDEELGIQIRVGDLLGEHQHAYPSKLVSLRVYMALTSSADLEMREHDAFRWCLPHEISVQELSPADRPFVTLLMRAFE